jgi:hypothetical protein
MKKLLLIITVLFGLNAYSQSEIGYLFLSENFIPLDKQIHGAGGIGIGSLTYAVTYGATNGNRKKSKFIAIGSAILAGTLIELSDINTTGFDLVDLAYTAGGGVVGAYTFDLIFARAKKRNEKRDKIIAMTDAFYD